MKPLPLLLLITFAALLVHGYHPDVEDGEIYVPGIKQALNPALYPHNDGFFASHAHMTFFPNLIAASVRITHLPLYYALLLWQVLAIFLLLLACWEMGKMCFPGEWAAWGGVLLVASLLTLPVAGTSLYIMDQYLNTRSLSAPGILLAIVGAAQRRWLRAAGWIVFTGLLHPLMVVFGVAYILLLIGVAGAQKNVRRVAAATALLILPLGMFPPMTDAYREAIDSREYFFLLRWAWYEWLGIFGPMLLLWWYVRIGRKQGMATLELMCKALVICELVFFAIALVITIPPRFANLTLLQPMRALHLVYILLLVSTGGLLAQWILKGHVWRWLVLFVPLCAGMFYTQRQLFPATPHLELPWTAPNNVWVRTFLWIRENTPVDAYFALDPEHMAMPGEDQHGFRAVAERSMLADKFKDSGAVTMFPGLAEEWRRQVRGEEGWKRFQLADFQRLKQDFGVNWVVLQRPAAPGLVCPYRDDTLTVCGIP